MNVSSIFLVTVVMAFLKDAYSKSISDYSTDDFYPEENLLEPFKNKRNQPDLLFQQFRAKKMIEKLRKRYLYRILSRMRRSVLDIPEDASQDDYLKSNEPQVETADQQGNADKDLVFTS